MCGELFRQCPSVVLSYMNQNRIGEFLGYRRKRMAALPFKDQEYAERLSRVRQRMGQEGLDALIVTGSDNMYYVSGFRGVLTGYISPLMAIVIPAKGLPRLITRSLELRVANEQWTKNPILFMDHEDPFRLLADLLTESGAARGKIGVEENNLTVWRLNKIKQALSKAQFQDASGIIKSLTARPSKMEVEYVRKAASIANIGFARGIEAIKAGIFGNEVVAQIHRALFEAGQSDTNVGRVWCWFGPEGGQMHNSSLNRKIQKGDLVTIELTGVFEMYRANAQGTVYVGDQPSGLLLKTYKMVSDMYQAARDTIKPGAKAGEVYDGVNKVYRPSIGEDYFRRIGGSMSLGSFVINLVKGNQDILNPGVDLLVQPLVNEPFLITCSSTILVTEAGREELTTPLLELKTVS